MFKIITLWVSLLLFSTSIIAIITYDIFDSINSNYLSLKMQTIYIHIGFDSISLSFIFLTTFFIPLCILYVWEKENKNNILLILLMLEILLILVFLIMDLFLFYIVFEIILMPFFFLIGISGKKIRRIHAAYLLFFYTVFGSIFMLISIIILYNYCGTTDIQLLWYLKIDKWIEYWISFAFIISFSIKIPIFPFHIWLPEAHVESPTEGSVLLAAILLKIGLYGFLRIIIPIFPNGFIFFSNYILMIVIFSVIYTSFITLRQIDIKRIIAYSSIGHMNICMIGICLLNPISIIGSIILMIGHGFVSAGLFFLIGMLYNRYKTKIILYYSGLVQLMPIFSIFFFFYMISNISFPGTSNFIGELLILYSSSSQLNWYIISFFFIGTFVSNVYSIWALNRVLFGIQKKYMINTTDINKVEFYILLPITIMILIIGINPNIWIDLITLDTYNYYNNIKYNL